MITVLPEKADNTKVKSSTKPVARLETPEMDLNEADQFNLKETQRALGQEALRVFKIDDDTWEVQYSSPNLMKSVQYKVGRGIVIGKNERMKEKK